MVALALGRFDEASALREQAAPSLSSSPEGARCFAWHAQGALRAQERLSELAPRIDADSWLAFGGLSEAVQFTAASKAMLAARLEDSEATRLHLSQVPEDCWLWHGDPPALMLLGEAIACLRHAERARQLYEGLLPFREQDISWGLFGSVWEGPADRVLGLLAEAMSEPELAVEHFERALARLEQLSARPYLSRTRYELARMLVSRPRVGDQARISELLRLSREAAVDLQLPTLLDLLAKLEARAEMTPRKQEASAAAQVPSRELTSSSDVPIFSLVREGELWSLDWQGPAVRLKDSRGLAMLARLLASPEQELHARELAAGNALTMGERTDAGDAGEMLDERAISDYRQRVTALRAELEEAEEFRDSQRAERLRSELDSLSAELSRAVGLGGRSRRSASSNERARIAVQRRLKDAISRIGAAAPAVGRHLQATIHTGLFCVYRPTARRRP
jgi:hypothetical protein